MMDWNSIILSKIKKIYNSISSTQNLIGATTDTGGNDTEGTLMAKENAILGKLNSIPNIENLLGNPNDTGGSQTMGTVMGKENAILKKLTQIDEKIANNMILKQTERQNIKIPSSGYQISSFSFHKPVRILGIYLGSNFKSGVSVPVYIINGENSFQTSLNISSVNVYYSLAWSGPYRGTPTFRAAIDAMNETIPDVWATQIDIQIGSNSGTPDKSSDISIIYQEEG